MTDDFSQASNSARNLALVPIVVALLFAPLGFGGTTPITVGVIDGLLLLSFLGWILFLLKEKRLPRLNSVCLGAIIFLQVYGVVCWLNPKSIFFESFWGFDEIVGAVSWLPGTIDKATTQQAIIHYAALSMGLVVLIDLTRDRRIRSIVLKAIALSGFVITVIGIAQKAGGAENMLWVHSEKPIVKFFAAFRYHANAAAFLNLSWPAALTVWLHCRTKKRGSLESSFWLTVLFFTVLAVFVNTSKAGHVLGLAGILICACRFRNEFFSGTYSKATLAVSAFLCLTVFCIVLLPSLSTSVENWNGFIDRWGNVGGRITAYGYCINLLGDSGIYGKGPGTFHLIFPFYREDNGSIGGVYSHAHQDYLQAAIEWGFVGATAWLVLIGGGILRASIFVRRLAKRRTIESSISCGLIALVLVLTHALIDFPLQIPAIQLQVLVYLAIFWAVRMPRGSRKVRIKE
tara:strand:- start:7815 stop:9191 length:1377 start_codon:yes stop_codon:yes gene_type:complete